MADARPRACTFKTLAAFGMATEVPADGMVQTFGRGADDRPVSVFER